MKTRKDKVMAFIVIVLFVLMSIGFGVREEWILMGAFIYLSVLMIFALFICPTFKNVIPRRVTAIILFPMVLLLEILKHFVSPIFVKLSIRNVDVFTRAVIAVMMQVLVFIILASAYLTILNEDIYKFIFQYGFYPSTVIILGFIGVIFFVEWVVLIATIKLFEVLEIKGLLPVTEEADHFNYDKVFYTNVWQIMMLVLLVLMFAVVVFAPKSLELSSQLVSDVVNVVTFVTLIMLIWDCCKKWWAEVRKASEKVDGGRDEQ